MLLLTKRVAEIAKPWPPSIKREMNSYLQRFYRTGGSKCADVGVAFRQPYWFLLPAWLRKMYNRNKARRIARNIFDDILWAQYCVFLSIRIKDDLFDGEMVTSPLFFASDQFMAEACGTLHRHLKRETGFWPFFTASIKGTINAFWMVDAMQQRRRISLKRMRSEYSRVSSIFKIGSAAICHLADRPADLSIVETASDELAVAGQILDDFQDMGEDLSRNRLNYAARFILGSSQALPADRKDTLQLLAECVLYTDRVTRLFDEAIEHVQAAERQLSRLKLSEAARYFPPYLESLEQARDKLAQEQFDRIKDTTGWNRPDR